jgi:hypothetical protein
MERTKERTNERANERRKKGRDVERMNFCHSVMEL